VANTEETSDQFLPFLVIDEEELDQDAMGGLFRRGAERVVLREIPAQVLRESLSRTITMLSSVLGEIADESLGMPLAEVQIGVEVSASGGIQLVGTAQAGTTGAITLVFRKG
jgi:hypothetical protein